MPKIKSRYTEAKRAEYDGNIELAGELYLKAIEENDRVDSAIKDHAGILHMKGETKAAIKFMESQPENRRVSLGFKNLLSQLKSTYEREVSNEGAKLPHVVLIWIDEFFDLVIDYESIRAILPNSLKISKITFVNPIAESGLPKSTRALIEFGSHSAARKAVMVPKHASVKCVWASEDLIYSDGLVDKEPIQLVKGGPKVAVRFANVPLGYIENEWPNLLLGSGTNPQAPVLRLPLIGVPNGTGPITPERSRSFSESRLSLASTTPSRPRSMALDMTEIMSSCASMDWCMNTPSPVKHMACLL